jgi:adenine-specific DNA-methyltransferase
LRSFIAGGYSPVIDSKGQSTVFEITHTGAIDNVKSRRSDQQHILTVLMNLGTVETAGNALSDLGISFPYPKPVPLVKYLVSFAAQDSLVLDFFSGSSTTAHAVMQLNAEDGGSRRHISVQWPEDVTRNSAAAKSGVETIDQIGRQRIQLAAEKIQRETKADLDCGFRLFRLEEPNEKTLEQLQSFDPNGEGALLAGDFVSKFGSDSAPGVEVALATWLLRDGFGLTPEVQAVKLAEYELSRLRRLWVCHPARPDERRPYPACVQARNGSTGPEPPGHLWLLGHVLGDARAEKESRVAQVRSNRLCDREVLIDADPSTNA